MWLLEGLMARLFSLDGYFDMMRVLSGTPYVVSLFSEALLVCCVERFVCFGYESNPEDPEIRTATTFPRTCQAFGLEKPKA